MVATKTEHKEEEPIHGDVLEAIFSFVPLIDLVPSCHVSKSWNKTVFSSLTHVRQIKPWLIVFTQTTRASRVTTAHAYDPRSHAWLQITKHQPLINKTHEIPAVRSSHSTLLYTLSPSEFTFSIDALHLEWHKAPSPRVWRTDPIVARVGNCVVVAGGACEFEDDPLAVELYNMESRDWATCQLMPTMLTLSASTWLSVAVVGEAMLVTERISGVTYMFNTITMKWEGPYNLRPNESVFYTVTGTLSEKLTVAGLVGEPGNVREVKLWAVKEEIGSGMEEIGSMPKEMVEKLKGDSEFGSIEAIWVGNFVYLRNTLVLDELVVCEVVNGSFCEWRSVKNAAVDGGTRMVFCGGDVKMEDLQRAVMLEKHTFCMKQI